VVIRVCLAPCERHKVPGTPQRLSCLILCEVLAWLFDAAKRGQVKDLQFPFPRGK